MRRNLKEFLSEIVDILCEEDIENRHERTIGDCLEYFLSCNMFEIITAYTKSDKPRGFFKIGLSALIGFVQGISSTSILSQLNIHQSLLMLLNSIYISLSNHAELLNYDNKSQLSSDISDVILLISEISLKAYDQPYVVNLFFTNVKKISAKKSERGDYLPLKILLAILKEFKSLEECKDYIDQCYYTIKIILRTNSKQLDEYIMNESDLIEILMAKLTGFYNSLPERVSKKKKSFVMKNRIKRNFLRNKPKNTEEVKGENKEETKEEAKGRIKEKVKEKIGVKIKKIAYANSSFEAVGIRDMIIEIFGAGDLLQNFDTFCSFFWFFNEVVTWTINKTMVDNLVNKFFNEFLLDIIQPAILNIDDSIAKRTWIQYYVHMAHLANSYRIVENLFFFLFGFPEGMKPIEEENKEIDYDAPQQPLYNENEDIDCMMNDFVLVDDHPADINNEDETIQIEAPLNIPEFEEHEITIRAPMIRIGNQLVAGPQKQPEDYKESRGRESRPQNKSNKEKKGRSVSVLSIKNAKAELDLLSAILQSVENVEKQVEEDFNKNEEVNYECKIKVSSHQYSEISKSLMMWIISDEEYHSTASLKLIEVFLK